MIVARSFLALVVGGAIAACDNDPPQTPPPQPSPTEERITGTERIGWDQQAAGAAELATFRYAMYVDGSRSELTDVSCSPGPSGFACSARLPAMSPGSHTLELAAFVVDGGVLESGRSAPFRVLVTGTTAGTSLTRWGTETVVTTTDRVRLTLERVTEGLVNPTDLAFAPDGWLFIAERAGRVRVVRGPSTQLRAGQQLQAEPALALEDVSSSDHGGLLALALDPQFQRTGFVYVLYTTPADRGRLTFRLARFREANGTLAQRAILLDGIPANERDPAGSLRFGADGKLYVAFDDGGDARRSGDLASFNGKILRMNPDGTTPSDQAAATPVYSGGFRSPRAFDWQTTGAALWVADVPPDGAERLSGVLSGGGTALRRGAVTVNYALPPRTRASSLVFYRGASIPGFRGDLLIASNEGHILRLRFDDAGGPTVVATERLLQDRVGPVHVVAVSPGGEIYFCTADALGRLVPTL